MPKNELPASQKSLFESERGGEEQLSARDKKIEMILERGFSLENIEMKTDLTEDQIIAITRALMYADLFDMPIVAQTAHKLMQLNVSKKRLGRKEWFDLGKSFATEGDDRGFLSKIVGPE